MKTKNNNTAKLIDIATIAAILSDTFGKNLYESKAEGIEGYESIMRKIAFAAIKVYNDQQDLPNDLDWVTYFESQNIFGWDDWVIEQGKRYLF